MAFAMFGHIHVHTLQVGVNAFLFYHKDRNSGQDRWVVGPSAEKGAILNAAGGKNNQVRLRHRDQCPHNMSIKINEIFNA